MKILLKVLPLSLALAVPLALAGCGATPPANEVAGTSVVVDVPSPVANVEFAEGAESSAESVDASSEPAMEQVAYSDFTQARYDKLLANGQPFALFFHASWCPTCWAVEADILENIEDLPEGAIILKTDYDTYTDLKAKYKVKSQSVIVMVDSNGQPDKTLVAPSFKNIKNNFTKLLP